MLSHSKESVINTLLKFNKEGVIRVSDTINKIINKEKLQQIMKHIIKHKLLISI